MTSTATLTDRYVDAAMRTVPENQRPDLAAELRASIEDQIDARVASGESVGSAERAVLTEFGDPEKLAADYTDRPLYLVGPRFFLDWWRLLKLLLWIIVPLAAVAFALGELLTGGDVGDVIGGAIGGALSVGIHVTFWVTLGFAIADRAVGSAKRGPFVPWTVDKLPESKERRAGLSDLIGTLVFLGLGAAALLWDRFFGFVYFADAGEWMPFFAPSLWPWWIVVFLVLLALEALLAIFVYAQGRWTAATAWANAVLSVAFAVPALWLLARGELVNPEFFAALASADAADTVRMITTASVAIVIVVLAVWDIIDVVLKARRSR